MATSVHELELPELAENRGAVRAEQIAALRAVQTEHWLARVPFGFIITRYDDVVALLRDKRFHQAASLIPQISGVTDERFLGRQRQSILTAEGDDHTRLRRLVAPAFSPRSADRLRPFMREVVNRLLDPVAPTGRAELVADVCEPYPIPIICKLLGAPESDWKLFSRWATDILRIFSVDLNEQIPYIVAAQDELDAYTRELIAGRRDQPGEDLLTDLIAAEEAGDRLSSDELVMMAEAVLVGGTDTTRNQLACTVALFLDYPDQWALLAERPELASRAVEESMRFLGAIGGTGRVASVDIEYRDVVFPAGTLVFPSLLGANYDGGTWTEPERFDITRQSETPQLTFGSGIHYCLGAALARAELQEALPILARRFRNMEADGPVVWKDPGVGIWGPARLPLRFTPS